MNVQLITPTAGTRELLRTQGLRGHVVRVRRGLYTLPDIPAGPVAAAVHRLDAVASHTTAAALWGIATLNGHDPEIRLTRPRRKQGAIHDYRDVILHHATLSDDHVGVRGGIPVTSVARTVVDLARSQSFRAGVVAADSALRQHLCERDELEAVAAACRGWPGVRRARAVVAFADSRAASPLESISRVAFHDYDLPRPILQALIGGLDLVDFLWERWRVVGEADGLLKYIGPEVLRKEKLREEGIAQLGFAVFRWTWRDAFERPDALAYRAAQILVRNGWRP